VTDELRRTFLDVGIRLSSQQVDRFHIYHREIIAWNPRANLISKKDEKRILGRHFIESAALSRCEEIFERCTVLDLGSGGGFPGLPLKIVRPDLSLTLLDAKRWKALFLTDLVAKMGLQNVWVVNERAESLSAHETCPLPYDVVVSRAVANPIQLYRLARPLLKNGGCVITLRGSQVLTEMKEFSAVFPHIEPTVTALRGRAAPLSDEMHIVSFSVKTTPE